MRRLFTVLVAVIFTASMFAQAPQKMSYQAVIRNSSNALVTSSAVGMRISILQGSVTGTVVYTETQTPNTNANGLVSVEIGGGAGFNTINWANDTYYIKTETDPAGGTNYNIIGISQLLSVPYALHAKTAENGFSGNYIDLTNKPNLFDGKYNSLTGKPTTIAGYGITDAMTTEHAANGITATNITNWTTAYGWGAHSGLYRPISYVPEWNEITSNPFNVASPDNNQLIRYNSTTSMFENWTPDYLTLETDPKFAAAFNLSGGADIGDILMFNGTNWAKKTPAFASTTHLHTEVTSSVSGFMSGADKTKLDAIDGSETKITAGAGVVVKGNGTSASPYIINATQHTIGEIYGGGVVFYVWDNGFHGLIAATVDAGVSGNPNLAWIYGGTLRVAGAVGNGVGAGQSNTLAMIAVQSATSFQYASGMPPSSTYSASYAAANFQAQDVQGVRYNDWYIPSQYEMTLMIAQVSIIPGFSFGNPYWTSTEQWDNANYAYMCASGTANNLMVKSSTFRVRPIRKF